MGLETVNYVDDLVETNPVANVDQKAQGDDHIRNIKKGIKATFPGLNGRAWRTVSRSASAALDQHDNMTQQDCAAGITLTPGAASTLGNGWMCFVRAGSGNVTIDPAEPINGATSYVVPQNYHALLMCDGTEFFVMLMYMSVPQEVPAFPPATVMLFNQTTAPTGWTKVTSAAYNDSALRITTGAVGAGGSDAFSTHFGSGKTTGSKTLSSNELPPINFNYNTPHNYGTSGDNVSQGGPFQHVWRDDANAGPASGVTNTVGGGASFTVPLTNFNIKYVDCIAASKD